MTIRRIAIVGAGMSGLSAADILIEHHFDVQIFEKSRGCGGRMATRRSSGFEFDHGAQYFTVRDKAFQEAVDNWVRQGVASCWDGRIAVIDGGQINFKLERRIRYVGTPRMNSVVRSLARGIRIAFETRIAGLEERDGRWQLISDQGAGSNTFEAVILAIPPAQASELMDIQNHLQRFLKIPMHPCWAVMTTFKRPLGLPFDAAFVNDSIISWISRNSSKPKRGDEDCWVAHGSPDWSSEHLEAPPEWVAKTLLGQFFNETGSSPVETSWVKAHRWRYAQALEPHSNGFFWDSETRLGVCGDWCNGSRVEGAFLSGKRMAEKIIEISK